MKVNVSALMSPAKRVDIVGRTLAWWDRARRDLAWRALPGERPDPYRVWLSEILLQQTTVQAVTPYFQTFITRWPTVEALAAAPGEVVISAFAGLGYYSRARNLHACAKEIARRGGRFPQAESELRALPGVGAYTAAAVAAIAFDRQITPVDGNIARIFARLLALGAPVAENRQAIEDLARILAPAERSGDFAQALMDLGAVICRPRRPNCGACPLRADCAAFRSGTPEIFPARTRRGEKPKREGAVFFAQREDRAFLARRRPPRGLLASTVELPGTEWTLDGPGGRWKTLAPVASRWTRLPRPIEQQFTHFRLRLVVYAGAVEGDPPGEHFWVRPDETGEIGFSNVMRKAADYALSEA